MEFDANTPRTNRTIAGNTVSVIQPFNEATVLTPALAAMLNQTLAENFSNNLRKRFQDGVLDADGNPTGEPLSQEQLQALTDEYMASYEPGVRSSGGGSPRVSDPVEREARKIAREKAKEIVIAQGHKPKDVDLGAIVDALFAKYQDQFMAEGQKIVAAMEKAAAKTAEINLDGIDLTPKAAAA